MALNFGTPPWRIGPSKFLWAIVTALLAAGLQNENLRDLTRSSKLRAAAIIILAPSFWKQASSCSWRNQCPMSAAIAAAMAAVHGNLFGGYLKGITW